MDKNNIPKALVTLFQGDTYQYPKVHFWEGEMAEKSPFRKRSEPKELVNQTTLNRP